MSIGEDRARHAYIIDDDRDVRVSISVLLRTMSIPARPFACAQDFLQELPALQPGCLILDISMPGQDGLELLSELRGRGCAWPVAIMTGNSQVKLAVRAMKLGALEFLEKPFTDGDLAQVLEQSFQLLDATREADMAAREVHSTLAAMSRRERDVLSLVIDGCSNKLIARQLSLSPRTVEMHRARLMKRVGATNAAELLRFASQAGLLGGRASAHLGAAA